MCFVNVLYLFGRFYIGQSLNITIAKSMKIDIVNNNKLSAEHLRLLKNRIKLILKNLNVPRKTELCITLIDDNAMRELNKTYLGKDKTTDVLSFQQDVTELSRDLVSAIANKNNNLILGDIIISVDTAKKHAREYGNSLEKEVNKLIIHGILHLLGHDHKRKKDTKLMREKEDELLSLIESIRRNLE